MRNVYPSNRIYFFKEVFLYKAGLNNYITQSMFTWLRCETYLRSSTSLQFIRVISSKCSPLEIISSITGIHVTCSHYLTNHRSFFLNNRRSLARVILRQRRHDRPHNESSSLPAVVLLVLNTSCTFRLERKRVLKNAKKKNQEREVVHVVPDKERRQIVQ